MSQLRLHTDGTQASKRALLLMVRDDEKLDTIPYSLPKAEAGINDMLHYI